MKDRREIGDLTENYGFGGADMRASRQTAERAVAKAYPQHEPHRKMPARVKKTRRGSR